MILGGYRAQSIYDLLVRIGGAREDERSAFIHAFVDTGCEEWRFQGKLGFGGKYRGKTNTVDCYSEDETPQRLQIIEELNKALSEI